MVMTTRYLISLLQRLDPSGDRKVVVTAAHCESTDDFEVCEPTPGDVRCFSDVDLSCILISTGISTG